MAKIIPFAKPQEPRELIVRMHREDVIWRAKKVATMATGHFQCAMLAIEVGGFDPFNKELQDFVYDACERIKEPVTAAVKCEVCKKTSGPIARGPLPRWAMRLIQDITGPQKTPSAVA